MQKETCRLQTREKIDEHYVTEQKEHLNRMNPICANIANSVI